MKLCKRCGEEKDLSEFYRYQKSPDGRQFYCKKCLGDEQKSWHQRNPEKARLKQRINNLKVRFGLTIQEYNELGESQGWKCAICGNAGIERNPLCIDHCHDSGKVRGLLCRQCNQALGLIKENVTSAKALVEYIRNRC